MRLIATHSTAAAADQCKDKFFFLNLLNRKHSWEWSEVNWRKSIQVKTKHQHSDHITGWPKYLKRQNVFIFSIFVYILLKELVFLIRFLYWITPHTHLQYTWHQQYKWQPDYIFPSGDFKFSDDKNCEIFLI